MIALLLAAASPAAAPSVPAPSARSEAAASIATASGVRLQVLEPGTGPRPGPADMVRVTYEGRLADGTLFDTASEPVELPVSALIPGFTEALQLMQVGGRYLIRIPPALAYGERGAGGVIPPNAELEFTVTLVEIGSPTRP